ncbi:hypothetical protein Taro_013210 [Colocasia esculenta]|uniref:Uncharacterized protein n=1 Tax=Colocasia esculenta TaxID=4460 RepID=A0A843UFB2_COLES|nr:hypothetical protein [Colocasia esculenta]
MDKAKGKLKDENPRAYRKWWEIIDERWEMTLHHELHVARYFFNPRYQYNESVHKDGEVLRWTINVIERMSRTMEERIQAQAEVN